MIRYFFALLLALPFPFIAAAQPPAAAKPAAPKTGKPAVPANDIFFSGTVTASLPDSVTVVRKVPARADETRIFAVDKDTKIEGKLRVSARVTVRFKADSGGIVHALRVIVRADGRSPAVSPKAPSPGTKK